MLEMKPTSIVLEDPPAVTYDTLSGKDIGVGKSTLSVNVQIIYRMLEKLGEEAFLKEKSDAN